MQPEQVNEMLKNYKAYVGRCAHLEIEIKYAEQHFEKIRDIIIEASAYHVQDYSTMDMPKGTGIGNPTEQLALKIASGSNGMSEIMQEDRERIKALKKEYAEKMMVVRFVEAWLSGLTDKERWLLTEQVIEGKYWHEILRRYEMDFIDSITKDSLKRIKRKAMQKIYDMAG